MTMDTDLTHLLYFIVYQVFPYVVITVWLVGSFIRFLTLKVLFTLLLGLMLNSLAGDRTLRP